MTETRPSTPTRYVVAPASAVPEGERLITEVGGRKIGILNVDGRFHALLYSCPHSRGPLCEGVLQKRVYAERPGDEIRTDPERTFISCPWHGWLFDLDTGQSWWDPSGMRAREFPVEVQHGDVIREGLSPAADGGEPVKGPYVAETFSVDVEDDYIVVTMRPRVGKSATGATL